MTALGVLDVVLIALAVLWAGLGAVILIDRARYDRRTRRADDLRQRLTNASAAAADADTGMQAQVQRLTADEFAEMTHAGLPPEVEARVARQIRARHGAERVRRIADGSEAGSVWQRVSALQLLASSSGPGVYRALHSALRSGEPVVASAAVRLLIKYDDRQSAELLVEALLDGVCARARVAAALERMSVPRDDLLAPVLRHAQPAVRAWGARLAGRIGASEWAPQVRTLATDTHPVVRRTAVEALGRIGNSTDRDLLLAGLRDEVPMVRAHAARSLAAFATSTDAHDMVRLLGDRNWMVRAATREALRRLGSAATNALLGALWDHDRFAANSAAEVLHLTGVTLDAARRLLRTSGADPRSAAMLARFLEVGGEHLREGLLSQLTEAEADRLLGHMEYVRKGEVA